MADQVDRLLKDWATNVHPGIAVSLGPPGGERQSGRGIGLYLMELLHTPSHITAKRAPLQLSLRYLVTSWSDTPEDAHQLLTDLAFAALANPEFQVELDAVPLAAWAAFGTPPLPSFIVRVPLRQARPEIPAKLVRQLQITSSPMVPLHGIVLGPEDTPVAEARVEISSLKLSASSDYKGRFRFPAVPAEGSKVLRVRARGREISVRCEKNFPDRKDPLVIHFTPLEN